MLSCVLSRTRWEPLTVSDMQFDGDKFRRWSQRHNSAARSQWKVRWEGSRQGIEEAAATTAVHRAPTTRIDGQMHVSKVPFVSMCPTCAQMRPQPGYDRNSLLRLLGGGYPVEAYCSTCDQFWSISANERAGLIGVAIAAGAVIVC